MTTEEQEVLQQQDPELESQVQDQKDSSKEIPENKEEISSTIDTTTTSTSTTPTTTTESSGNEQAVEVEGIEHKEDEQPEVSPALATEGGREISHKILYVGGLVKSVSEDDLREIFSIDGIVQSVKIMNDKNRLGLNYAFVEYDDEKIAENAFNKLNKSQISGGEININYAYQSQQAKNDPNSFNIFVGDLSTEVDDELLKNSFSQFQTLSQAHVMWDMQTGRSRGYGFVSFLNQQDAEIALESMNGALIANRAIRLNWAAHKAGNSNGFKNYYKNNGLANQYHNYQAQQPTHHNHHHHQQQHHHQQHQQHQQQQSPNSIGVIPNNLNDSLLNSPLSPIGANSNGAPSNGINILSPQNYDLVLRKSPTWQTTVYLGNLARFTTQNDLIPLLQNFGFIVDLRFMPEKSCAFVKYDSHERAALAIVQLNGFVINGRPLKSGWGKDRSQNIQYQNYPPLQYGQGR